MVQFRSHLSSDKCHRQFVSPNKRKARDLNPHPASGNRLSRAARPTISAYLPNFSGLTGNRTRRISNGHRSDCQPDVFPLDYEPVSFHWTAGESNPDFLIASQASFRWTSSPFVRDEEVRPGFEPGLPPYRGGVPPKTPTDRSDPGWS